MRSVLAALLFTILAACSPPAAKAPVNPKLDALFGQLAGVRNAVDAAPIEQKIWGIWNQTKSPTVEILMERAQAAEAGGDPDRARSLLDQAAMIAPDFAEIYDRRAMVAFAAKDTQGAIDDIEHTLRLEPRHFGAYAALGMIYESQNQNRAALEAYNRALAIHPFLDAAKQGAARLKPVEEGQDS